MAHVLIIDYQMGNTDSIRRAIEENGASVVIGNSDELFDTATHIILPGVGSFHDGMSNINKFFINEKISRFVIQKGKPLLGICLGMQMLAGQGTEGGIMDGLGLIPGTVMRLEPHIKTEKIPHVGWNEVEQVIPTKLLKEIPNRKDFYFVHSYHFQCENNAHVMATTPYCGGFVSVVSKDNIWGTQFHPEKSQRVGFLLLKNFLDM